MKLTMLSSEFSRLSRFIKAVYVALNVKASRSTKVNGKSGNKYILMAFAFHLLGTRPVAAAKGKGFNISQA